jgi:Mn2+/Fe2+ NRAMP family transporter
MIEKISPGVRSQTEASTSANASWRRLLWSVGPGLVVMVADVDAGNVVTAAEAGAQWRYRLLPLLFILIPFLYVVQELTVRLGVFTGRGHGELVRERFGGRWACLSFAGLAAAAAASLITQLSAIAGVGELYGIPQTVSVAAAAAVLLGAAPVGWRRVERLALFLSLFELSFFALAYARPPHVQALIHDAAHMPFGEPRFLYLAAAVIGATFSPWMIFYQQSAIARKRLQECDYAAARWETAAGAVFAQVLTAAILVAAAATFASAGRGQGLGSIGQISNAFTAMVGGPAGRLLFSVGLLGSSMTAAVVSSVAFAWGAGELAGWRDWREGLTQPGSFALYAALVLAASLVVCLASDLVWLNLGAQVLSAVLLPQALAFLVALSFVALPPRLRPGRGRLFLLAGIFALTVAALVAVALLGLLDRHMAGM